MPATEVFSFDFDTRFRVPLALLGVTPGRARVTLDSDRLVARYGFWSFETSFDNVTCVSRTGPYRWYTSIGARGSMVDRGLTFGTTPSGGVCVLLREPVPGLLPIETFRHPGLTVTVAEPDRFVDSLRRRAGLDSDA
jgi:hypothetical protein